MTRRRVLITGGLGFQGLQLALASARAGDNVTVMNTPSPRAIGVMLPALLGQLTDREIVKVILGSVTDAEVLEKAVQGQDVIVHMAAWASVDQSLDRPWPPWEVNAEGTLAVLEAVRRFGVSGVRVVIASSCEVYGPAQRIPPVPGLHAGQLVPQDEDWPMQPRSPYAASKVAADRMAYAYAVTYDMNLVILRPCNVYGPWQRAGSFGAVIPTFVTRALDGQALQITGGGEQVREFVYIDDLVAAYRLAMTTADSSRLQDQAYNVGTGETTAIRALAIMIAGAIAGSGPLTYSDARVADVSGFLLDSRRFREQFSWKPEISFEEGLRRYITWAREHERRT